MYQACFHNLTLNDGEDSLSELDIFLYHKFNDQRGKEILIEMNY